MRTALISIVAALAGCSPALDSTRPGAYIDLRNEPRVNLSVVAADGSRTELHGSLRAGSWRSGTLWNALWNLIAGDQLNRGQLFVETPACGTLYFILDNRDRGYCIGCRTSNFRPGQAQSSCPLQNPDVRDAWGQIAWMAIS